MNKKKCRKCGGSHTKKDGFMREKQRYKCCTCGHVFQNTSRKNQKFWKKLWEDYAIHKQTYGELARKYGCSERTIQSRLDSYDPWFSCRWNIPSIIPPKELNTSIILLIDTTYFGHDFGIMIFRSSQTKEILCTMIVDYETNHRYQEAIWKIQEVWWIIQAIVCDGRKGLLWSFTHSGIPCQSQWLSWFQQSQERYIPTQMCQFHQVAIVLRATTKKPKTQANKELKQLAHLLPKTDRETFTYELERYGERWWNYLKQKTLLANWRYVYTHKKTRSAFFSLVRNLQYLFTWYDYHGQLDIPNTTNGLEGIFGHLKAKVSLHRWLKRHRKLKLILMLLYSKNPSSQPHIIF